MASLADYLSPPDRGQALLDETAARYPFIKQYRPKVTVDTANANGSYAETWPAGEPGDMRFPRPANLPMDRLGVQVFQPEAFGPDDLAGEALHIDPEANRTREALLSSLSARQNRMLRDVPDYNFLSETLPEKRRRQNGMDALVRGHVVNQWPAEEIQRFFTPQQMFALESLKRYMTKPTSLADYFDGGR